MRDKIFFYGGLPRSGSHFLSDILNQNPVIHSEGLSALCSSLWKINKAYDDELVTHELGYSYRDPEYFKKHTIEFTIKKYYENIDAKIILDKNRSWTIPSNIEMIKKYIDDSPSFIILERDIRQIVRSFIRVYANNNISISDAEKHVLNIGENGTNPLMRPISATISARLDKTINTFFIDFNELVSNPKEIIFNLYNFLNIEYFSHNLYKIEESFRENADLLLPTFFDPTPPEFTIELSKEAEDKISEIEFIIETSKKTILSEAEKCMIEDFCSINSY